MTSTSLAAPDPAANEESRARQTLGLDDGPDIDTFIPQPTALDRKRFKALVLATPALAQSMTIDTYKAKHINARIVDTVKDFMNGKSFLIRRLSGDVLRLASAEELRATPSVFLLRILNSTETLDLADRLLKKLKWYGALPGEQTPAAVRYQLVCKAICLYLHAPSADEPQELAGFRWQDPAHLGKSYQTLRSEFEQHLLHTRRVINTHEAILLAHVFQTLLSKDFAVRDIPSELRYKSSVVWVNFMHGVLLADELGLNRSQPLSFQQLVDLPLEHSVGASPETLETIARLRLSPALEWAVCMGVVKSRTASDYDKEDIKRAMAALESQSESLSKAVMTLDLPPPERMKMAKQVKDNLFGADTFESDGRKFLPEMPPSGLGPKDMPTLKLPGHAFLDLYADGQFDDGKTWFITGSDGKTQTDRTFRIDDERNYHAMAKDHYGDYRQISFGRSLGRTLPDINAQFEIDFRNYLTTIKTAYQTLIVSLLASLPLADRWALEQGDVQVLSLRQQDRSGGQQARKGFVLKVSPFKVFSLYGP
ncbi:hypothetical protein [Pseudomonas sp. PGPR40]|uniref:hypothetical protein n=1 Tax=Pseudomonas sp. PGPR40 TaxID=2913476 RepID=UPI001EDB5A1B|nr:hypothetical protein [Pseudomonas sp. PGPR40]